MRAVTPGTGTLQWNTVKTLSGPKRVLKVPIHPKRYAVAREVPCHVRRAPRAMITIDT